MEKITNDQESTPSMKAIILASASPRRQELFTLTGWTARVMPAEVDERQREGEGASALAIRLARTKAAQIAAKSDEAILVLAADTIVSLHGEVMGKPSAPSEAQAMLKTLAGVEHSVVTALALEHAVTGERWIDFCETRVPMRAYGMDELRAYVESGKPYDKAGAYGIQDDGFRPVAIERLHGCYANVMGLPLCHLVRMMRSLGHDAPRDVPIACQEHTGYTCPVFSDILREAV